MSLQSFKLLCKLNYRNRNIYYSMKLHQKTKYCISLLILFGMISLQTFATITQNAAPITALINRIGGVGAADRFVTITDASLSSNGKDIFIISSQEGKPCIKGNNTLAVTTGLNWYLNHYAHINLAWNNLTTDLTTVNLPLPSQEEKRDCSADYRYYLNYCTFSYSMSVWTWERWQKEIDWMALHGINMPLQIIGLDVVWKNLLTKDLGYTSSEANKFIAGPCFQAWWGMNNLQGWGGPNPDWWYTRQEALAKKILARERELGMQPVLPGYAGMAPSDITSKAGIAANNQGNWCTFVRPYILDPNSSGFSRLSALYYKRLNELMGTSTYYSIDPFHEGANTDGIDVPNAYTKMAEALYKANADAKWVIQYWQWSGAQYNVLSKIQKGKLIVLDLFSEAVPNFGSYKGHEAIYCNLPNFGGRTGLFGRLTKTLTEYFDYTKQYSNIKGVGATPEAIEQVPVLYDALFELPWYTSAPDAKKWLADYATARYGTANEDAQQAWENIRNSALNCNTGLQGPQEAVLCARPSLSVNSVSTWGGTEIFYDAQKVVDAAYKLLKAKEALSGQNYSYDLTDFTRQAFTDYGNYLLKAINDAANSGNNEAYAQRRDAYLQLILDLDELLNTNQNFMLGRWTNLARGIADEEKGTSESDKQWLELNNARTLITTWGDQNASEWGGLRDYSYREWGGMLKDFYYKRWKTFFDNRDNGKEQPNWFNNDWAWAHDANLHYSNQPVGVTADVANKLFGKYFVNLKLNDGSTYHLFRYIDTDLSKSFIENAMRGESYTAPISLPDGITATLGIDFNNDGTISADEIAHDITTTIPSSASTSKVKAQVTLSDGTTLKYVVVLKDNITKPRTVCVKSANDIEGHVSIVGSDATTITNTNEVTIKATPNAGYDFANWTDETDNIVSTDNPYTYYGAKATTLTAHFLLNKWGSPKEKLSELDVIKNYHQYVQSIAYSQNGNDETNIYNTSVCPSTLFQTSQIINAAKGSELIIHWQGAGGLNYCNLSAYADWNANGSFDDANEMIATFGQKKSDGNAQLNNYTLKVLLPYDATEGLTHLRLRFDGAWQTGYNANGAMPAKADAMRMVYDIPVNIMAYANTACTITVATADTKQGTVDANGQPDTYTYKVGEDVILRCYPANGYQLDYWADQYGRKVPDSWYDGTAIRFKAAENGTYTAHFKANITDEVSCGNWKFRHELCGDNLILTQATQGNGELNVPQEIEGHKVIALKATALQGQTALTSISLPSTIVSLGSAQNIASGNFKGEGINNALIPLNNTLTDNTAWRFHIDIVSNGASFNQWGSAILATGNEALAGSYYNGFQFYQKADGSLILKTGSEEDGTHTFECVKGNNHYSIDIDHSADNTLTFNISAGDKTEKYALPHHVLIPITQCCTALPVGIDWSNYIIASPNDIPFRNKIGNIIGAQVENAIINPQQTLANNQPWSVTFNVENNGQTFNEWGSGLLATGNGALNALYNDGFQLYLKRDKAGLILKTNGEHETEFNTLKGVSSFNVKIHHTTNNDLIVSVNNGTTTESHTIKAYTALQNITQFSTAIPVGVNIKDFTIINETADPAPFRGCTALKSINIESSNPYYATTDGTLYTADGTTLVAYPEGCINHTFTLPQAVTHIAECAITAAPELDRIICNNATPANIIVDDFKDATYYVQVSPNNVNAYHQQWNVPLVLNVSVNEHFSSDDTKLLSTQDAICLNADDTQCATAEGVAASQSAWLTFTPSNDNLRPMYFPQVPQRITVEGFSVEETPMSVITLYKFNGKEFERVNESSTGAYLVQIPASWKNHAVTLHFNSTNNQATVENHFIGNGTLQHVEVDQRAYQYNAAEDMFYLLPINTTLLLSPFTAALVTDQQQPANFIAGPRTATHIQSVNIDSNHSSNIYDLKGQRIMNVQQAAPGVYISKGKKVLIK